MEAKRNRTDCPLRGEGQSEREKSLHIEAAHFLTNYCCKTSLSQTGPSLPLLSLSAVWDRPQDLESVQRCRRHK
ncbi:hypothetical protein PBY51_006708 [Eleginops maclovinus]|uniref:Uncharacterized protein n=1 Tax=Eleginops maclovinus TaxID=56733 RepID=A0AAN7WVK9_ELEMC|nr:hypothetical protein PBY51_006708 [Eleginops maclovinus]